MYGWWTCAFFSLGRSPRRGISELHGRCMYNLSEPVKLFPEVVIPWTFPPAGYKSSRSSSSSPICGTASLFHFSHSNRRVEASHYFNSHSPNDSHCGASFLCLWPSDILGEVCSSLSPNFFPGLCVSHWVWEFLIYSGYKFVFFFNQKCALKILLPVWGLPFHSLNYIFWGKKEVFKFYGVKYISLSFYESCFWSPKKPLPNPSLPRFSLMFFSRNFRFYV